MKIGVKPVLRSLAFALGSLLLGSTLSANTSAEERLMITDYHTDQLAVYNLKGNYQYDLSVDELPKPKIEVAEHKKLSLVKLVTEKGDIWLSKNSVKLSRQKITTGSCSDLANVPKNPDHKTGSTIGLAQICE